MLNKKPDLLTMSLTLALLVTLIIAIAPPLRKKLTSLSFMPKNNVLSSIEANIFNSNDLYKIVKIRRAQSIDVEIFKKNDNKAFERFQLISLPNTRDAYFEFGSQTLNLAIQDMDDDGVAEIIVPVFNEANQSFLAIYKYNIIANKFEISNQ